MAKLMTLLTTSWITIYTFSNITLVTSLSTVDLTPTTSGTSYVVIALTVTLF